MSVEWSLLLLVVLFLIGIPVTYALGITAVFIMAISGGIKWLTIGQQMMAGLNSFTILAVPLFLLAGKLMNSSGVTERLFKFALTIVGWLPGGLGHVNVVASMIFAGMSGTAIADASGLGLIEIKAMNDAGYDKEFSCGVTCASSTVGPLIPPSMPLVVYGVISGASIGALFIAGILPGILMGIIMMVVVSFFAKKRKYPREKFPTVRETFSALKGGIFPLLAPVIILLGIYTGVFTPTESASIVVFYSLFLGMFVYREINLQKLIIVLKETVIDAISICILISSATLFGNVIVKAMIPQHIMRVIMEGVSSPYILLLVLNVSLLIVGMFMETVSSITILTPIMLPLVVAMGISPVHFGIILVLNLMIGVLSPPFGVVLFAVSRIGDISYTRLSKGLIPWLVALILSLALITYIPQISLWLPKLMGLTT